MSPIKNYCGQLTYVTNVKNLSTWGKALQSQGEYANSVYSDSCLKQLFINCRWTKSHGPLMCFMAGSLHSLVWFTLIILCNSNVTIKAQIAITTLGTWHLITDGTLLVCFQSMTSFPYEYMRHCERNFTLNPGLPLVDVLMGDTVRGSPVPVGHWLMWRELYPESITFFPNLNMPGRWHLGWNNFKYFTL